MKFRKKPVVIEAAQWNGTSECAKAISDLIPMDAKGTQLEFTGGSRILVNTLEGTMVADLGDWIIRGITGELYPCKPDIFEATYEAVEEVSA